MTSAAPVLMEQARGVAVLRLNRPQVLNALNDELMEALLAAMKALAEDEAVRCVVVTGAGRGFCAGGDLNDRRAGGPLEKLTFEARQARLRRLSETVRLLHEMEKPTIAMINGPCAGAGVGLAGACDLRFAAASAVIKSAFVDVGLSGDYGSPWFWTRLLGSAKAREFMLLSEKMDAETARAFGLFTRVFPDDALEEKTMEIARRFASKLPWAYALAKDSLNSAEAHDLASHLDIEGRNMIRASRELARAAKAAAEKKDKP